MTLRSPLLDEIIAVRNSTTEAKIVFVDVVGYSKRRTLQQVSIVKKFTEIMDAAITDISAKYVKYTQGNNLNFAADIVKIPTGDGMAVGFCFSGLPTIHLDLALRIQELVFTHNSKSHCEVWERDGWSNCHDKFELRIGISDGRVVIYKDINGLYNISGSPINYAARIMSFSDGGMILLTADAHNQIIDLTEDSEMLKNFVEIQDIKIKHGITISIYQYIGDEPYLRKNLPKNLHKMQRMEALTKKMDEIMPMPGIFGADRQNINEKDAEKILESTEALIEGITNLFIGNKRERVIEEDLEE
jgi:Adenylate and Guanylate cyclase catalytic domain